MGNLVISGVAAGPCGCCTGGGGEPPDDCFSCRTKGTTAMLCGYPEFAALDDDGDDAPCNVPAKMYRKKSYTGSLTVCTFAAPGCDDGDLNTSVVASYGGVCEKDAEDCSQVSMASVTRVTNHSSCGGGGTTVTTDECPGVASETTAILTVAWEEDCTVLRVTGTEDCFDDASGNSTYASGEVVVTLSDEDTEDDAIARLQANEEWSDWGTDCVAGYQVRTDTSFAYTDVEWRVTKTGLLPLTSYDVDVEIWRRPYGSGSYALYSTITASGTTDGAGNLSITDVVPNDRGYESEARCDCVITPS